MSVRKKLNIVCITLFAILIVNVFLPLGNAGGITTSWWDQDPNHIGGIIYIIEFVSAIVICVLYHFNILKDSNFSLLFCGEFLADHIRILYYIIKGEATYLTYGYWLGLILILGVVTITIVSNSKKEKNNMSNKFNNPSYGQYNNVYQQPNVMYGNQMNNNVPPMGYNNYR